MTWRGERMGGSQLACQDRPTPGLKPKPQGQRPNPSPPGVVAWAFSPNPRPNPSPIPHSLSSITSSGAKLPNLIIQVLNQDQTPLLYSLVSGEGVRNYATLVIFNAVQNFDLLHITTVVAFQLTGNFFYLFYHKHTSRSKSESFTPALQKKEYYFPC
ncbi:putative cation/H+ exchanger, CPA1 family, na+/H+ exchanger [Helianthus annuus]|nr:putative cation/H+ exchanger, CPA1 family, na+/H+ exchanger [Helianthus annuus]KAJ0518373.1 putative cation/H+ exchanger, CPA1 family [Helianthus annuus]KAJ0686405.1 putative cation/H+ exchanger, CPA1 family [Helianthus annuus]KAJ0690226.1 putative cation/H+ exchanger, CPA1 family [Helianthus annuus]KAJ0871715.1 putative cation/H+ exchanger, CPA1 family, na+/H+ exchanger [Helianthus annuus]